MNDRGEHGALTEVVAEWLWNFHRVPAFQNSTWSDLRGIEGGLKDAYRRRATDLLAVVSGLGGLTDG